MLSTGDIQIIWKIPHISDLGTLLIVDSKYIKYHDTWDSQFIHIHFQLPFCVYLCLHSKLLLMAY